MIEHKKAFFRLYKNTYPLLGDPLPGDPLLGDPLTGDPTSQSCDRAGGYFKSSDSSSTLRLPDNVTS